MLVSTLPCKVIWRPKALQVVGRSRKRKHWDRFAHPYAVLAQVLLEIANLIAVVVLALYMPLFELTSVVSR